MKLMETLFQLNGQRELFEAKMKEFEGLSKIGSWNEAERCREDAHALIDAWFDGQADFAEAMRRGQIV